jgi:hypothetical protein
MLSRESVILTAGTASGYFTSAQRSGAPDRHAATIGTV